MELLSLNFILVANILKSGYFIVQTQVSVTLKIGQSYPWSLHTHRQQSAASLPGHSPFLPSLSPAMSLHLTPELRTQLPAQHFTPTMNPVELDLLTNLPPTAFLPPSWWNSILGLILDSFLSLKRNFQDTYWLSLPNTSRF